MAIEVLGKRRDPLTLFIAPYTKTSPERIECMISSLREIDARGIEGDIVECGVWRGGNIILARKVSPDRICWLYDTFTGMPEPGPHDGAKAKGKWRKHWCEASIDDVIDCLVQTDVYDPNKLRFCAGDVAETLLINPPEKIALLRLDTDWYESTKLELEVLYPRLQSGGVLIVDDYGHWQGSRKAVDEYFRGSFFNFEKIDYTAIKWVKP